MTSMISVSEAHSRILEQIHPGPIQTASLNDVATRTLRTEIVSSQDSPPFDKSLMDGFAVAAEDLTDGRVGLEILELVPAGSVPQQSVSSGQTIQVMTGATLPLGTAAVIPVERSSINSENQTVTLETAGIVSERNVLRRGTVLQQGQTLLSSGTVLRPSEVALLAEMGYANVEVTAQPIISILATGDELVHPGEPVSEGQIRNSNAPMLAAQVQRAGARPRNLGIGRDQLDDLREKVGEGLSADFLLLSGGVSAGEKDFVPQVLSDSGVREIFHKVRVKPGKPIWFGVRETAELKRTYVFGLPGNPVSSMLSFELFVRPAIRQFLGQSSVMPEMVSLPLSKPHVAAGDRPTYYPSHIVPQPDGFTVEPVDWKGSSDLLAPTRANAWIMFPAGDREYVPGDLVEVLISER